MMPRGPVRSLYMELGTTDYERREENNDIILAATFFFSSAMSAPRLEHVGSSYSATSRLFTTK